MKRFDLAIGFVVLGIFVPSVGRADIIYSNVESLISGEAFVSGSNDSKKSQHSVATGPFNATLNGASGSGVDFANYSASINSNITSNAIIASGNIGLEFMVSTVQLNNLNAFSNVDVQFSVPTPQSFTLNGSLQSFGYAVLRDRTTNTFVFNLYSPTPIPVTVAGTLNANDSYELQIGVGLTTGSNKPPVGFNLAGGYDLAFTTSSTAVPEPSTFALFGLGGIGLAIRAYRGRCRTGN